jgi:hypothetical protein
VGPAIVFDTAESKNKGCFIIAQRTYLAKRDLLVEIKTLTFGGVNCYLLSIHSGFLLIDTRRELLPSVNSLGISFD